MIRIKPAGRHLPSDQGQVRTEPATILTIAGQRSVDGEGRLLHDGDIVSQLALALANVAAVVHEAGLELVDIAQLRVYTTDIAALLDVYDTVTEYFGEHGAIPPITVVEVRRLGVPALAVEVDGIAIR